MDGADMGVVRAKKLAVRSTFFREIYQEAQPKENGQAWQDLGITYFHCIGGLEDFT
jgi:hypothetical protein